MKHDIIETDFVVVITSGCADLHTANSSHTRPMSQLGQSPQGSRFCMTLHWAPLPVEYVHCDTGAPLPRDIPNETVKALVVCLVFTIFLATATLAVVILFFLAQTPAGPRSTMFLRLFDFVNDSRSMAHRLFVITFVWSWRRIMQTIHTGTRDKCGELSQAASPA